MIKKDFINYLPNYYIIIIYLFYLLFFLLYFIYFFFLNKLLKIYI